jgi:hypothetical protein
MQLGRFLGFITIFNPFFPAFLLTDLNKTLMYENWKKTVGSI